MYSPFPLFSFFSLCMSFSLSLHLSVLACLSSYISLPLSFCLCVCVSVCLCLSVSLSLCLSVSLSVCLSICLSVCLSVCLSLSLSLYLSLSLSFISTQFLPFFPPNVLFPLSLPPFFHGDQEVDISYDVNVMTLFKPQTPSPTLKNRTKQNNIAITYRFLYWVPIS